MDILRLALTGPISHLENTADGSTTEIDSYIISEDEWDPRSYLDSLSTLQLCCKLPVALPNR